MYAGIDLPTFRALLGDPTWYLVTQFLVTGRWYEEGLDLALQLLGCTERYHHVLSAREEARARMQLYALVLDMLDRLDAWDTYLKLWHQLRQHTTYTLTYGGGAATLPRAQPYVMRREGNRTALHFLWISDHRKQLIERKLAKQRAGRPLGNMRHHPQSDLSDAELRRRLAWVAQLARSLRRPWTDAAPTEATSESPQTDALVPSSRGGGRRSRVPLTWSRACRRGSRWPYPTTTVADHRSTRPRVVAAELAGAAGGRTFARVRLGSGPATLRVSVSSLAFRTEVDLGLRAATAVCTAW